MLQTKFVEKMKMHILYSIPPPKKNHAIYEICGEMW